MTIRLDRRVLGVIALIALVASAEGAVAFAATPIKGATYAGKIARTSNVTYSISFRVSAKGKRVSNFTLANGYPVYCQGGGFGAVQKASGSVAKNGTFDVKLPIYFSPTHQHQGFVIITGSFAKHGKESGKVMTDFTHGTTCNGTSRYATKG
jgi:hypothetical protein